MPGVLHHSPADILSRVLIALSLGTDPEDGDDWPIYAADEPAVNPPHVPDEVIVCQDTIGTNDGRDMISGERQEHHGIQVRVRSRDHTSGWEKASLIHRALNEQVYEETVTISNRAYLVYCMAGVQQILELRRDASSNLRFFVINALMSVREVTE